MRPVTRGNPNHRLATNGEEYGSPPVSLEYTPLKRSPKAPTVFIRSRQDEDPSVVNPMSEKPRQFDW